MIFHEVYGCYYNAVAKIIAAALDGNLTKAKMYDIIKEYGYEESILSIVPAITEQEWQLIDEEFQTPILEVPTMPLTTLEKRWLKTILLDKRASLFMPPMEGLEDVEPLFLSEDLVYFDRYLDGDDYDQPEYIANFQTLLNAIRGHRKVEITYWNKRHQKRTHIVEPRKLEYSDKEDKFRLIGVNGRDIQTVNLGRIIDCKTLEAFDVEKTMPLRRREIVRCKLVDERNALERVMMKFAHHKKQIVKLEENLYEVEIEYDKEDETDMVIQLLSFGQFLQVEAPDCVRAKMQRRLKNQMEFATFFP